MFNKKDKISIPFFVFSSFFALFFIFSVVTYFGISKEIKYNQQVPDINNELGGTFYLNNNFKQNDPYITRNPNLKTMLLGPIITSLDPSKGGKDAVVNLVYFSDFKCDYCHDQESILKKIEEKYGNNVRIIWKDYPEEKNDPLSFQASLAARCAQDQNKFWDYHDLLFENNDKFSNDIFVELAKDIGLDIEYFKKCLVEGHGRTRVRDNIIEANALEITGIPFIYVNSQEIMGEINIEDLERIVEIELNKDKDVKEN